MIVRILSKGKSFSGAAAYLTHDQEAQTSERVAWTHTLNLASDHVPSAVDEMLWTARNAELLKQEAGVRAGGRATENPVKHLSLNWSPEDHPSQQHMIATTEEFLRHMKWQEHQAVLVAHSDKPYEHVHVMLNTVNPETGLRLDDGFEQRRAQTWALQYEREQGRVYCEQRLKDPAEREPAPPRNMWMAFQQNEQEFANAEKALRQNADISADEIKNAENRKNHEWQILKEIQKDERAEFFSAGKSEFSALRLAIYREVREEFRERWRDFYACQDGTDPAAVAARKAELVADQRAVLEGRRDEACSDLRDYRDGIYRELLDNQRDTRLELRTRQQADLENAPFLQSLRGDDAHEDIRASFRDAAETITQHRDHRDGEARPTPADRDERSYEDLHASLGAGGIALALGVGTLFDSFLTIFEGPPRPLPRPDPDLLRAAADDACKRQQREQEEENEQARQKRERSVYGD